MTLSIRYQILAVVFVVLVVAIMLYLYLATSSFERDRIAYSYDLAAAVAQAKSEELHAGLQTRVDRLRLAAQLARQPGNQDEEKLAAALRVLFDADENLVSLALWKRQERGYVPIAQERHVSGRIGALINEQDLVELARELPDHLQAVAADGVRLFNISLPPDVPLLRLGFSSADGHTIVMADYYPERLLRLVSESKLYEVMVVDGTGKLIAHPDRNRVVARESAAGLPIVRAALAATTPRGATEVDSTAGPVVGTFAAVELARLTVIAQIPKREALLAVHELNRKSLLFAGACIFLTLLIGIFMSRRIAAPLGELEEAFARVAAGGRTDHVEVRQANEIGRLAEAFNHLIDRLSEREEKVKEIHAQLQVQDRMALMGTLAASVAHEINNPLTFIMGNRAIMPLALQRLAETAKRCAANPEAVDVKDIAACESALEKLNANLEDIGEGAERIKAVVGDLKTFSRVEEERDEPIDVQKVIDSSVKMAWHEIKSRATVVRDYQSVAMAKGSEPRLGQVFLNILVNAAQAMPAGNVPDNKIFISTSSGEPGSVVVEIRDTGSGMSPETLARITEPFFTTKASGVGTGLGMTICRNIIKTLGGKLEVESEVGSGTTVRVTLRRAKALPQEAVEAPAVVDLDGRRLRILAIDDERAIGDLLIRSFGEEHQVVTARNGHDGLDILLRETFDVVLCDLIMPEMTGMEVYAALEKRKPELLERIVFITGGAFTEEARVFLKQIPNHKIDKPFDADKVLAVVREVVA